MTKEKRFYGLAFSYVLGVFNDNAFKFAVIFGMVDYFGKLDSVGDPELYELKLNSEVSVYFFLPFVLFSTIAGWACDRYRRSKIMEVSKISEIIVMSVGAWGLFMFQKGNDVEFYQWVLLGAVFLMALQSTFFSPARNSIIPQLFREKESSEVNGMIEMMQFMGIILGMAAGALSSGHPALLLIFPSIACVGYLFARKIPRVEAEDENLKFNVNIFSDLVDGYKTIRSNKALKFSILGEAYFYALGTVLVTCIINMSKFQLGIAEGSIEKYRIILLIVFSVGMGVGCFVAGKLSRGRIELGLVPLGIAGVLIFMYDFSFATSFARALFDLTLIGLFAGCFVLPLKVFIQQRSEEKLRGRILAMSNFIAFSFMLGASLLVYYGSTHGLFDDTRVVLRQVVAFSLIAMCISFYLLPEFVLRFVLVSITRTFYKMDVRGEEKIPETGPVLLLPNHVSWLDGVLITAATSREVKFMVSDLYYNHWLLNPFFRWLGFIAVPEAKGRKAIIACLTAAKESLERGEVVCIFPEGQLTRSGVMSEFKTGFTRMKPERDDLTIIPVYLGLVWGSIFSFSYGKKMRPRLPTNIPYPMSVRFGEVLPLDVDAQSAREAVRDLEMAVEKDVFEKETPLHYGFMKYAKSHPFSSIMQDSNSKPVKNISVLQQSLSIRNWLKNTELADENYIGIVLPSCVAGSISALSIMYADKVPVFLNFTSSADAIKHALKKCNIRRILTSKIFLHKLKITFPEDIELVYLEDLAKKIPMNCKLKAALSIAKPRFWASRQLFPKTRKDIHATATVLFSSGSTGTPKGVVLSHYNFTSNLSGIKRVCDVNKEDILLGTLPLFHCFGFLSAFWMPLTNYNKVIYHPNPLESVKIGEIIERFKVSIMFGTPTFLNNYSRKCKTAQMASLRLVLCGAEKLRKNVAEAFFKMSGVYPLEAYGATELSPAVSVNIPLYIWDIGKKPGKAGSVGHPIPGVQTKIVDQESGEALKYGKEGLLLVKGPGVMKGYLGEPEKTAEVLKDGWYNTGDLASMDKDGYIALTGRLSRFSKIAGEMVPHGAVEELIHEALKSEDIRAIVVGRPDSTKGEKLMVFHLPLDIDVSTLIAKMKEKGMPNLWIPKANNFVEIEEIPLLGSGKLDLKKVNELVC